jgi:hypothetical protein
MVELESSSGFLNSIDEQHLVLVCDAIIRAQSDCLRVIRRPQ